MREKDPLTKVYVEEGFFEKSIFVIDKFLFFTIIFAPYMMVLNDIYLNKLVHNNVFWIKRAKIYFIFILLMYLILWAVYYFRTEYALMTLVFVYGFLYLIWKLQLNYGHLFATEGKEYTPTEEELKNIIAIQNIDNDAENRKNKIKFRTIFAVFFVLAYIFIFNVMYQFHYLASILSLFLIAGYDYYEQKYFKRDKTELFWKKRVMFYVLVLSPILVVLNFIIYN
ncbi:hypothetical protein [Arcobacter cloacae]|uniref:Uncharacterized protein n=1 Tax=Arcobacter cloacae TaxID=1054034 RepID=A0A6M8NMI2_9BACT|nr:hypothetical protein [Arcobacter cloacae]QKF90410.1 putative membrane protein [Arcobacter cloacae]RXI37028.1 hypothetical protein CP963_13875 [Arcobacter cloacae]